MNKETIVQNRCQVMLSENDFYPYRMNVGMFYSKNAVPVKIGIPGTPDILVLKKGGGVFWIEFKTDDKYSRLRKDQIKYHAFLNSIGHRVYVVRNEDECRKVIEDEKIHC